MRERAWAVLLLAFAVAGWWWSARMPAGMPEMGAGRSMAATMSFVAFLAAWTAMMAAMMFPAIVPVVRLYDRAAGRGVVAPTPVFVMGYLVVWAAVGSPAWLAWRALDAPLMAGAPWAGRLAGGALLAAAVYQLTPLKAACLRHCRSPMSFFMHVRGDLHRPLTAARAGAEHGIVCFGCCWALMVVLVAVGTMNLLWMAGLAVLVFAEKVLPGGELIGRVAAAAMAVLGLVFLLWPASALTMI